MIEQPKLKASTYWKKKDGTIICIQFDAMGINNVTSHKKISILTFSPTFFNCF